MQGAIDALVAGILMRGISPALASILMAPPSKRVARAQLKKIYVLDERGDMAGEYVLDADCPIDYSDFLKVLPGEGIGDRDSLFVGEYVFTAFQSGTFVFVLLSRGSLAPEDFDWTALLLTAADSHLAQSGSRPPARVSEPKPEVDRQSDEREARLVMREKSLAELEARLEADAANVAGRHEELDRQKARLSALADYGARMQDYVAAGTSRALKTLEMAEQIATTKGVDSKKPDSKAAANERASFEQERKALESGKTELETRYQEAKEQIAKLEKETKDQIATLEKERAEAVQRTAQEEKTRKEIELRVADLSQRFAEMAKERLVTSHRPNENPDEVRKAVEGEKAEVVRERKFLQRRAIELLDREERVRDREVKSDEREREMIRRGEELQNWERDLERRATVLAQTKSQPGDVHGPADEAKKDIERRIKIIQQKALELLDREEKLRKRAAELQAMEARLSGRVTAE